MTRCASSSPPTASPARSRPARPPRRSPRDGAARRRTTSLTLLPLSDGGPGFCDVLTRALGGQSVAVTVSDPLGRPVPRRPARGRARRSPHRLRRDGPGLRAAPAGRGRARPLADQLVRRGAAARGGARRGAQPSRGGPRRQRRQRRGSRDAGRPRGRHPAARSRQEAPGWPTSPTTGCRGCVAARERFRGVELVVAARRGRAPARLPRRERVVRAGHGRHARGGPAAGGRPGAADRGGAAHAATGDRPAHRRRPPAGPRARGRRRRRAGLRPAAARRPRPGAGSTRCCRRWASTTGSVPPTCWSPARRSSTGRACEARWSRAPPRPRSPSPSPPSCWPGRPTSVAGRPWRSGSAGPTRWRSAPTGCPLFLADPAGTLAARAARVATTWSPRRDGTSYA